MTREKLLMDRGWKFHPGDIEIPEARGHFATYMGSKSERGRGPAATDYYDGSWENVNLPHDYVVKGTLTPKKEASHGSLAKPPAWYRRSFRLDESRRGKRLTLLFDGLGVNSVIYINGHLMARNFSLYNPVEIDFTAQAHYGDRLNTVAVYINNDDFEGWWYMGAGIYRHVWLTVSDKLCVNTFGVFVNPIKKENTREWTIPVKTELVNTGWKEDKSSLIHTIVDPSGKEMGHGKTEKTTLLPGETKTVEAHLSIDNPILWDIDNPILYELKTQVLLGDKIIDEVTNRFGFRTFRWDSNRGFFLNGRSVKIRGNCFHQDFSGFGIALPDRLHLFKMELFKEMGSNAVRSAHNLPAPEILDACDELGLLVMDENRWFNTGPEELKQVELMVKRDRNHPSVVIWSLGNEEPLQGTEKGRAITETLRSTVRCHDTSRPVTLALNGGYLDRQATEACDVIGINYNIDFYDRLHGLHPDKPITAPEAAACSTVRSSYDWNRLEGHAASYDDEYPSFGYSHRYSWQEACSRDYISGVFYWTGMDYRGEAAWPRLNSCSGVIDMAGFPKDSFYMMKALWEQGPDKAAPEPIVHILPHWNWPGHEDEKCRIMVFSNGDHVKLTLNGAPAGEAPLDPYGMGEFCLAYEPGELKAEVTRQGKPWGITTARTTGEPARLHLELEEGPVLTNEEDIAIIRAWFSDKEGRFIPTLNAPVKISGKGWHDIIMDSGNPTDASPYHTNKRNMFNGLVRVFLKTPFSQNPLTVKAESLGFTSELTIPMVSPQPRPSMPVVENIIALRGFRLFPLFENEPDLHSDYPEDQNSSNPIDLAADRGEFRNLPGTHYALYKAVIQIPGLEDSRQQAGFVLDGISGRAKVLVRHHDSPWPAPSPVGDPLIMTAQSTGEELFFDLSSCLSHEKLIIQVVLEIKDGSEKIGQARWLIKEKNGSWKT